MQQELNYGQMYYAKLKAKQMGITVEEYLAQKGKRSQPIEVTIPSRNEEIDLSHVVKLRNIDIAEGMLNQYQTGLPVDRLFSYESGVPVGTNIMCTGDPGVGKTTVLLHTLAHLQVKNKGLKCLFICAEMSKIQMFKYMKRFPIFGEVDTVFTSDYMDSNFKTVIEKLMQKGYDYVLMDSIVEVLESVKEDNRLSQSQAEKWLIDLCVKNNEGQNDRNAFTTFLLIQQVTKAGIFVGSNKMKHITDAHMEMKRESDRDGGGTYIIFTKNRNGQAGTRFGYQLSNDSIEYGTVVDEGDDAVQETFELINEVTV